MSLEKIREILREVSTFVQETPNYTVAGADLYDYLVQIDNAICESCDTVDQILPPADYLEQEKILEKNLGDAK